MTMRDSGHSRGPIAWFAANPIAANLLMVLVLALGVMSMGELRREAFPSLAPDGLTISVEYDSGSAKQSEEGLAIKIEQELEDVEGIDTVTSSSTGSGVTVTVDMVSGYDLDTLMRDVKNRVDAISTFPTDADNPVIEKDRREDHALWLQLHGDADRETLQTLSMRLKKRLLREPEIGEVSLSGWQDPMMVVEIREGVLQAYGLSLSDVEDAINDGSSNAMTATLRNDDLYLQLKASEQAYQARDFARLPLLTTDSGRILRLGEVADVRDTFDDEDPVLSRFEGRTSIALQVVTTGQSDIADSVAAARRVIEDWRADPSLPHDVELDTWFDRSQSILERLSLLVNNAITGIVLVFLLLAVFLNLSVAFWVAMGLPFIFFGTLFFMGDGLAGLTLNMFTTFGFIMALGIVVDDAVVVGESVYATRQRRGDSLDNTILGTRVVAVPTLFGVATTVVAFFALSRISGHLGQLYAQFATVVAICLVLSVIESKLILPAHLAHVNTRQRPARRALTRAWRRVQSAADGGLDWFAERCYRPLIDIALVHRYAVVTLFVALLVMVLSMPFTGLLRMSFFPEVPGDTVNASLTMHGDASVGLTHQALNDLADEAREADRSLTGEGDSGIAHLQVLSTSVQQGSLTVELRSDASYDIATFTRRWRELAGVPEGARSLSIQHVREMAEALRIELRASDDETLERAGESLKQTLTGIAAVSGIEDNLDPSQPQLRLALNAQGLALGMTTDDLASQVRQAFSGRVVQRYQRGDDEIEVKVRYPDDARHSVADVIESQVRTPDGDVVPLASVATLTQDMTRDTITRIDGQRAVYLSADVDKALLSSSELVAQLRRDAVPMLEARYPGLDIHFAGEAEQQAETQTSMQHVFLVAMLAIFMLLAIPLRSYVQPLLIMTAIPFGVVGALLGHWVNGLALGILSLNGIIALSGVVVNDSLLLVTRFNALRREGVEVREAIGQAGRDRLRAVLLTSVTTFAGLMPLLGETSRQAQFLIPAAVSLAYGIMFATVITLVLIPSLLVVQHDIADRLAWLKRRCWPSSDEEASC
ncbi:efflux RND transporter permease subunit [Halomonas sp. THAF12]|uniref:efflux RND transporter permease subunit n=1 Tax=Halomonas sp. THAF12 TaxID=2587849 RepID=UPI0020A6028B|nr:efflux RND transporter permease subunit [Halomonas sp. THAF12]